MSAINPDTAHDGQEPAGEPKTAQDEQPATGSNGGDAQGDRGTMGIVTDEVGSEVGSAITAGCLEGCFGCSATILIARAFTGQAAFAMLL